MVVSHSSGASSSIGAHTPLIPALATTMSSRPKCPSVSATSARIAPSSVTSATLALALPPAFSISAAVASTSSRVRLITTTAAPSRASFNAVALPIPDPAPVTSATLPSRNVIARSPR
ncbi:hypothetical protein D3C87_1674730 [compost metagenome]